VAVKDEAEKWNFYVKNASVAVVSKHRRSVSGSGWVAVAPIDRGDRCGSNGVR
jgi:hypothetical protein